MLPASHDLPPPPSLWRTIGPSFILLGLALGSGEVILWPYLVSQHGLGLLWGAALGISFQYLLNTEIMRYTLAWGESVFVGLRRLSIFFPVWFIISTVIPWSLPGFSSASAEILAHLIPTLPLQLVMVSLLIMTGLILTVGKTLYQTMERLEKVIVLASLALVIGLVALLATPVEWSAAAAGLVGRGDGWWFFPPGLALASFLAAFAYSGGGGNLNFAQSHYIKEKGFGMGAHAPKITSLLSGGWHKVSLEGQFFAETLANLKKWREWWRLVATEHLLVFWGGGLASIVLLAVLAHTLLPAGGSAEGLQFIYQEAAALAVAHPTLGTVFLLSVALMLFSTQVIVLEASSRIISENFLLLVRRKHQRMNLSLAFYVALWLQIGLGIWLIIAGIDEPRFLLTLAAVLNAAAMMIAFPCMYWLNTKRLKPGYQPQLARKLGLAVAFVFFVYFVARTLQDFQI